MASYVTPKKNAAFTFFCALEDQANAGLFKAAPTLASGDWKVSIDGGALNNLATLPTVTPTGGRMVKVSLSADEMNGDNITVVASDASGAEWYDLLVNIQTSAQQVDDLATAAALVTVDGIVDGLALVAPDNKPTVSATGEASANVTLWAGDAVAGAPALEATTQAILQDTGTTLPALIAGTGTGARTVTITVNDGTDPLENARVRLTEGANTVVGSTDVNGQVTFNRDDATYTVAITKAGYTFAGTSLIVDGNETPTYSMAAVSFSASDPGQSTGWVYCYDDEGNAEADVSISVQLTATPETDSYAFDTVVRVVTSEVDGLAEFTGLWIGATYRARRYNGPWYSFVVPNAASFALPVLLGR